MTDEELSHCVVSTVEYYEYKVLQELVGAKVRHIIPPIEMTDTFNAGLVSGADALSKQYNRALWVGNVLLYDRIFYIFFA